MVFKLTTAEVATQTEDVRTQVGTQTEDVRTQVDTQTDRIPILTSTGTNVIPQMPITAVFWPQAAYEGRFGAAFFPCVVLRGRPGHDRC